MRNFGNAVRYEICLYPMQQKSYRDRDCCSFVSSCNAKRTVCSVEFQLKMSLYNMFGLNGILIKENKSNANKSGLRTVEMHVLFIWLLLFIKVLL